MKKIYVSGNYVIVEIGAKMYEFARGYTRYLLSSEKFILVEEGGDPEIIIPKSEIIAGDWENDSSVVYTLTTFVTFLRDNTGFKTAGGGSSAFYNSLVSFPLVGKDDIIYLAENTGILYRWDGSQYVEISGTAGIIEASKREVVEFINKTGAPITKGTIVYLKTSSSSGTHPEVVLASASTEMDSSKTIGAVYETTANDSVGLIVTSGEVANLNTTAYNTGDRLWLSTVAGQVTTTPPTAPNHAVFIGIVTRNQNTNGRILYNIINGFEVEELHNMSDVSYSTPLDADSLLIKDNATSLWKRLTWANTKSTLKTYFDTLYQDLAPNIQSVTSSATVTMTSNDNMVVITAQAVGLTLANPTGTWPQGQPFVIRIKDSGVAQSIGYGGKYRAIGVTLPTTTTANKTTYLGGIYNATDDTFDIVGVNTQA